MSRQYTNSAPKNTLRAGLYLRVSDDKWKSLRRRGLADDRGSMVGQEREGVELIDDEDGWELAGIFADPDKGASRYSGVEREDWERLRQAVRDGLIDVVVLWESSRGDRKLTPWSDFLDDCRDRGVLVHIMEDETTYDARKPRDWKILVTQGVENEAEADVISRRRRRTVKRMQVGGQPDGRPTYGYKSVYDSESGKLLGRVPDEHAPEIKDLFGRFAAGDSLNGLWGYMKQTYPHRMWTRTGIRGMLTNPRYLGKRPVDGKLVKATWEPLITESVWKKCQARLKSSTRTGARSGAVRHLLSYLAQCAVCGDVLVWWQDRYICQVKKCAAMRADWLDEYVAAKVVAWWAQEETRAALRASRAAANSDIGALEDQQGALEARRDEVAADLSDPDIPAEITRKALKDLGAQIRQLSEQIRRLETPAELHPMLQGSSLEQVEAEWHRMTVEGLVGAQREIIRGTLQHVRLHPRGKGRWRTFEPKFVDAPYVTL